MSIPIISAIPTTTSAELAPSGISSSASFSTASLGIAAVCGDEDGIERSGCQERDAQAAAPENCPLM